MHQKVCGENTDSWYDIQDPRKRKRIQDRLAQRARRQRLKDQAAKATTIQRGTSLADTDDGLCYAEATVAVKEQMIERCTALTPISSKCSAGAGCPNMVNLVIWRHAFYTISGVRTTCPFDEASKNSIECPDLVSSTHVVRMPLPKDQNHLHAPRSESRAALEICGSMLGLSCGLDLERSSRQVADIPESLQPSPLQLTTPHYSWIDRMPFPRFRDNLILLAHMINLHDLLEDVFVMDPFTIKQGHVPWDPKGWRMTTEFQQKWGYLFH